MSSPDKLSILKGLGFLSHLPEKCLQDLANLATVEEFAQGKTIFREGQVHSFLYVVASGHVALNKSVPGRGPERILNVGTGELLGWSALLGDGRMLASAVALEDCRVVVLPGHELRRRCEADHEMGFYFMRQLAVALSHRLVATRLQLLDLYRTPEVLLPSPAAPKA